MKLKYLTYFWKIQRLRLEAVKNKDFLRYPQALILIYPPLSQF